MTISKPVLYLSGPEDDYDAVSWDYWMKFRLTYYGPLKASQSGDDTKSVHKHEIRQQFHRQLKQLWETNRFLKEHKVNKSFSPHYAPPRGSFGFGSKDDDKVRMHDVIATWYQTEGFNFLPLVSEKFGLLCALDILFLRHEIPGSVLSAGDIDNRIKTVIDALRVPVRPNEFKDKTGKAILPIEGEDPFYCLLEDDKHISHFAVETDTLLEPKAVDNSDVNMVKLIITVTLRPYDVTMFNSIIIRV